MSTTAEFANIQEKKLLGFGDFGARMLDHLREAVRETHEKIYSTDGVYDAKLTLAAGGNDQFSIGGTSEATDADGHILDIDASGFAAGVQFENASAVTYFVGLEHVVRFQGIQVNSRSGRPEYARKQDFIGATADPNAVVDNVGTITLDVDSVTETGVNNAGRQVMVLLRTPAKNATTEAIAIETLTVVFTGGINRVTTVGTLGQGAAVSTTPADYEVILLGPTVKRNTDLRAAADVTFIGTVIGVGAGSPPTTFDNTDQQLIVGSLSQLSEVTRLDSHGRLKIDVQADVSDITEDQIRVTDFGGTVRFQVDEQGNVTIDGDLLVQGTTIQQDLVQVNSSETITDNLTAGDNDAADSHLIKGTWRHTDTAATANYFFVDGATGRIGINRTQDATHQLAISGDTLMQGDLRLETTLPAVIWRETSVTLPGGLWRTFVNSTGDLVFSENTAGAGDFSTTQIWMLFDESGSQIVNFQRFVPATGGLHDLGTNILTWRDLHIERTAFINELVLGTGFGEGVGSNMVPGANGVFNLGSLARRFAETHTRDLYVGTALGQGVHTDLMPDGDLTRQLGSATQRWSNLFVNNLSFSGDFLPVIDNTQDIGSAAFRWAEGHFGSFVEFGGVVRMVPQNEPSSSSVGDMHVTSGGILRICILAGTPGTWVTIGKEGGEPALGNLLMRNWRIATAAEANQWQSVAWSAEISLFAAVSSDGTNQVMTSPDGINWTAQAASEANSWFAITSSPELSLFVAVSSTGTDRVMTSPDGINWTARSAAEANSWNAIAWSPELSLFAAVSPAGTNQVMTSPDGINWTARAEAEANEWVAISWSPELSLFAAVSGNGTNRVMTSPDGINWTAQAAAEANGWREITWSPELSLFAAVSLDGTNQVMTSPDGINWTAREEAEANFWNSITWSPDLSLFVAVSSNGTNRIMTSPDGINWAPQGAPEANLWQNSAWSPELSQFVAVSSDGTNQVMRTPLIF